MTMPKFTIEYQTGSQYCSEEVTARSFKAALKRGVKNVEENTLPDNWDNYENGGDALQFIRVCDGDCGLGVNDYELLFTMPTHCPEKYARDLLRAAQKLLEQWSKGNLSQAIQELQASVDLCEGKGSMSLLV
jgi:hypothetical protein